MARAKPYTQAEIDARERLLPERETLGIKKTRREEASARLGQVVTNYLLACRVDAEETPARMCAALVAARRVPEGKHRLPLSLEMDVYKRVHQGATWPDAMDAEIARWRTAAVEGRRPLYALRILYQGLLAEISHCDPSLRWDTPGGRQRFRA